MSNLFNNKFFDGLGKAVDVVLMGFYFLICCIPVFTIGASLTSLYYSIHKVTFRGRGYTTQFFHAFKSNFKQCTLSWLIFLLTFIVLGCDIYISRNLFTSGIWAYAGVAFTVFFVIAILWAMYHFAYIARFENTLKNSFKISGVLLVIHFGWSLLIGLITAVALLICCIAPITIIFMPGILACLLHPIFEHIFRKYMSPEDLKKEDD